MNDDDDEGHCIKPSPVPNSSNNPNTDFLYLDTLATPLQQPGTTFHIRSDSPELEEWNKEGRMRTAREILEAVDHPFRPCLHDVADRDRWSCILTEFFPGGDLHVLQVLPRHRVLVFKDPVSFSTCHCAKLVFQSSCGDGDEVKTH